MGSCASVVRKREMQNMKPNVANTPYTKYTSNNENYNSKYNYPIKSISHNNANSIYK
jgi:hypothetical protein